MAYPTSNKKGLRNPAVLAAASSPAGRKAIAKTTERADKAFDVGLQLIPFFVKTGIGVLAVYYLYTMYKGRFIKLGQNPNLAPANVSDGQAAAKANALHSAMIGIGADLEMVASQLAGLNYNGWVKVYNAFGNRKGINPLGEAMNLVEWLHDQFPDEDEMAQLQNVLSGVF